MAKARNQGSSNYTLEPVLLEDLQLINELSKRRYLGNKLSSNTSEEERDLFNIVKSKLKRIANAINQKYALDCGPFEVSVSSGNPIAYGGIQLNRVWAGVFKGNENKQYAAQISFVMNPSVLCLDVGFYFGRASSHSFPKEKRDKLEDKLKQIGFTLANEIRSNPELSIRFDRLFDYGFRAFVEGKVVTPDKWLNQIAINPTNTQIVYNLQPNDLGYVEASTIDYCVSALMNLMLAIKGKDEQSNNNEPKKIKPLTAEQRAKEAERRTLIGEKGELFVLNYEIKRLEKLGFTTLIPDHVASRLRDAKYDIKSYDDKEDEIYIEVKTTTRRKDDPLSNIFYISAREFDFSKEHKDRYCLYRVYDIEGDSPEIEIIDKERIEFSPESYLGMITI